MKNTISTLASRVTLFVLFLMGTILVNAQSSNTDPSWIVSKDVQKVSNKKNFENDAKRGSTLQAKSISQLWVVSKGVNQPTSARADSKNNVPSNGIPSWTISKGVHQMKKN